MCGAKKRRWWNEKWHPKDFTPRGGEEAKSDNTPLTRSPYFLAGSMLAYSPLVKYILLRSALTSSVPSSINIRVFVHQFVSSLLLVINQSIIIPPWSSGHRTSPRSSCLFIKSSYLHPGHRAYPPEDITLSLPYTVNNLIWYYYYYNQYPTMSPSLAIISLILLGIDRHFPLIKCCETRPQPSTISSFLVRSSQCGYFFKCCFGGCQHFSIGERSGEEAQLKK